MLLADIRQIFLQSGSTRISSTQLVDKLRALPGRHWQSALRGSNSVFNWLGHQLQRFGIKSRTLRIGPDRVKGYELGDFTQSFARWLES